MRPSFIRLAAAALTLSREKARPEWQEARMKILRSRAGMIVALTLCGAFARSCSTRCRWPSHSAERRPRTTP